MIERAAHSPTSAPDDSHSPQMTIDPTARGIREAHGLSEEELAHQLAKRAEVALDPVEVVRARQEGKSEEARQHQRLREQRRHVRGWHSPGGRPGAEVGGGGGVGQHVDQYDTDDARRQRVQQAIANETEMGDADPHGHYGPADPRIVRYRESTMIAVSWGATLIGLGAFATAGIGSVIYLLARWFSS